MEKIEGVFHVKMLGDFQMFWNDEKVVLKSGNATKAVQILQLLLYHAPKPMTSTALIDEIFAYDDIANPNNNLKASISQLRRQLDATILPCKSFIKFQEGGYRWNAPVEMTLDVADFEQMVKRGDEEQDQKLKVLLYQQAVDMYTGNFLPHLVGVDWSVRLNTYYANIYSDTVRKLSKLLKEQGNYRDVLSIAEQAYYLLHMEEWQILRIECLMQMGLWEEAKRVYNETVTTLSKEFDLPPSDELLAQYQRISEKTTNVYGTFDNMLKNVWEEDPDGAYMCAYPGFIDSCRVTTRNMMRTGVACYLMLCSIGDRSGKPIQNQERVEEASSHVCNAIYHSLRRSDFFTQYNKEQFLLFLVGACRENCDLISKRIEGYYWTNPVRGVYLHFEVTAATLPEEDDRQGVVTPASWGIKP